MRRLQELLDSNLNLLLSEIDHKEITNKSVLAMQLCKILEPKGRSHEEDLLSQLKEHLRCLLEDYVNPQTDSIGYAMPKWGHEGNQTHIFQSNGLRCVTCVSSLDSFVRGLIKGGGNNRDGESYRACLQVGKRVNQLNFEPRQYSTI